jgi:hypothetical protein
MVRSRFADDPQPSCKASGGANVTARKWIQDGNGSVAGTLGVVRRVLAVVVRSSC